MGALARPVGGDAVEGEAVVGGGEARALAEDSLPGETGLVDLEHEPLEEPRVVAQKAYSRSWYGPWTGWPGATRQ